MKVMGISAIYQKPNTSKKNVAHKIYPYLLKDKIIDVSNDVWCADITYIPLKVGFMYLINIGIMIRRSFLAKYYPVFMIKII